MTKPLALLLTLALALAAPPALAASARPSDETLLVAAQSGMEELVVRRIRSGANVDSCDHRGRTALMLASRHNNLQTVRLLLECGADAELVDQDGHTAAMWAARKGHVSVLHLILAHLEGTPAFDRQARLALGVIQRVGDHHTERALRELYPGVLGRGGAPAPVIPWSPPQVSAPAGEAGGFVTIPTGEAPRVAPPPRPLPTPPPLIVQPAGWPFSPPAAPPNNPLSELPPIPTAPPELAVPKAQ